MKKLFTALLAVLTLTLVACTALAEEVALPDPGYYFNLEYDGAVIWFDEYPVAEYNAYVELLTGKYGMEITESAKYSNGQECYLSLQGVEALVCCFFEDDGDCGLEILFDGDATLDLLDTYDQSTAPESGVIAWADGGMIADPGDFLGYEIQCIEYQNKTEAITKGYYLYKYEEIPVEDILNFAEAVNASSFFERNGNGIEGSHYWLFCYDYTGSDPELKAACAEGRSELRRRKSDLSIYIVDPYADKSMFCIYEYPGFTVNTDTATIPDNPYVPSEGEERCIFCNNGSCKTCGGSGQVYQWIPGENDQRRFNCTSCMNGRCTVCGGDGWK